MNATRIDRTPKPCQCARAQHQHGTRMAYIRDRCRCLPCCAANADYASVQNRQQAYGRTPSGWVDAEPVREHVRAVLATGVGWKRIGKVAGVANGTMTTLLYGKTRDGRRSAPCRRMNPEAARRLLALPLPTVDQLPGAVIVDGTGTRRRLQALATLGWSVGALANEAGIDRQSLDGAMRGKPVLARTRQAVIALYERLWMTPAPADDHRRRISISRTRRRSEASGWLPPAAWDDDTIDDPATIPAVEPIGSVGEDMVDEHAVELVLDSQPMHLTGMTLEVAVNRLAAAGVDVATIAGRVRSDPATVRRIRNTAQARTARQAAA